MVSLVRAMEAIESQSEDVGRMVEIIEDIGKETKAIHAIVFETKMLSFNASIEAARAGDHGAGFSVVAQEINSLAEMSGTAAHAIHRLLDESLGRANAIVASHHTTAARGTVATESCSSPEPSPHIAPSTSRKHT